MWGVALIGFFIAPTLFLAETLQQRRVVTLHYARNMLDPLGMELQVLHCIAAATVATVVLTTSLFLSVPISTATHPQLLHVNSVSRLSKPAAIAMPIPKHRPPPQLPCGAPLWNPTVTRTDSHWEPLRQPRWRTPSILLAALFPFAGLVLWWCRAFARGAPHDALRPQSQCSLQTPWMAMMGCSGEPVTDATPQALAEVSTSTSGVFQESPEGAADMPAHLIFRPYSPLDFPQIRHICATVYGGTDYLPRALEAKLGAGHNQTFFSWVLEDKTCSRIVATAAIEVEAAGHYLLLGVRTDLEARGRGYGTLITRGAIGLAHEHHRMCTATSVLPGPAPGTAPHSGCVLSITSSNNHVMRRVMGNVGFEVRGVASLFPHEGWMRSLKQADESDAGHRALDYLAALGAAAQGSAPDPGGECARWQTLAAQLRDSGLRAGDGWLECPKLVDVAEVLQLAAADGALGLIPAFYRTHVAPCDGAHVAVYRKGGAYGLVHVAEDPHIVTSSPMVAGIVASHEWVTASAILWAAERHSRFHVALDPATPLPSLVQAYRRAEGYVVGQYVFDPS